MLDQDAQAGTPVELSSGPPADRLSYREAAQSPCLSCTASPCCTHLLLRKFQLEDLGDVDYVLYLSNFEGILIGIDEAGVARAYLSQPCGHLDVPSGLCKVHGTQAQPSICVHYNAHSCQYRHGMTVDLNRRQPLMGVDRTRWYVEHVIFDDERKIVEFPDWAELLDAFESMPLERRQAPWPEPDPVQAEWRSIVLTSKAADSTYEDHVFHDPEVSSPCQGCEAWCCHTLVFGRELPENANQFDFFRYSLGFPSVELSISEESWAIVVRTTCRHLTENRCSAYGSEERPLRCGYYDAFKCVYKDHFGSPRPEDLVRVTRDEFPVLTASVIFDDQGRVRRVPTVELLRARIESAMRAGAI
jgi:hypothetical protein